MAAKMLKLSLKIPHPLLATLRRGFATACWNCNASAEGLFCPRCRRLQKPPKDANYFRVLDVKETYDVDETSLSKRLKDMQKMLHPDKFSNKTSNEQAISEEYSSLVNKAFSTLMRPLSRGVYMLKMKGIEIEEKTQLESQFLHEIMERNEEIENAQTPEEILKIEEENKQIQSALQKELTDAFSTADLSKAQNIVIRMKYYDSMDSQIKSIIRQMKIVK